MRPKSATTDGQGRFEFRDLPAGSYRLIASPGQYSAAHLPMAFGAKQPNSVGSNDPGTPIAIADGQTFDKAIIALPRGGVITGHVTDENGDPLARVQLYTVMYPGGGSRGMRVGGGWSTDDLGQFRLFGLAPGDYVIGAEVRSSTFTAPDAPPETEADRVGLLTTFYPAAVDEASAQRVRVRSGTEANGIEIQMVSGRRFHVNGIVSDSQGRGHARMTGMLVKSTPGGGFTSTMGFSTDDQGRFRMRDVAPGNYRLIVREQPTNGPVPAGAPLEFATMPLPVTADIDDLLVTSSPPATITGNIVFESGPPQVPGGRALQMRVMASPGNREEMLGAPLPPPALVGPDLTFTFEGLIGEMLLRSSAPNVTLKSVTLGSGEDITDTPHAFKSGERVTLTFTSRAATVEGAVTDAAGQPATDVQLVLFSDDRTAWRSASLRTRRAAADSSGHYRMPGVLPGRYYIVALPRDRAIILSGPGEIDTATFDTLSREATTLVVGEDEQRQVDVKVSGGG
jgi:protocatechuate 3,4-dioxygenase beta subunit